MAPWSTKPRAVLLAALTAALLLGGCSPDRIEVGGPPPTIAAATAGSCDAHGMTAAWESFSQDFNNGTVDVDTYFAPDFQLWIDPTDVNDGGVSRPQLAQHLADLHNDGVELPTGIEFGLEDGNGGTYDYTDASFQAVGRLDCVTGRIRTMEINY